MIWEILVALPLRSLVSCDALLGCIAISVGATPVGLFPVPQRMSPTGDAMAHAILPGAAIGYLISGLSLGAMTIGGLIAGMAVALLSGRYPRYGSARGCQPCCLLSDFARTWRAYCFNPWQQCGFDACAVRHGTGAQRCDIDPALLDCEPLGSGAGGVFRLLVLECADPQFLRSVSGLCDYALNFPSTCCAEFGQRIWALGTLMAVDYDPAGCRCEVWASYIGGLLAAAVITAIVELLRITTSYHFSLPSGPAIILVAGIAYVLSIVVGPVGGLVARFSLNPAMKVER